jgi:RNA polymerase sigma-70 factor, ECF subfamily
MDAVQTPIALKLSRSVFPAAVDAAPSVDTGVVAGGVAFAEVYQRHFQFVWRSLRLLGVPPEHLEDAAQDTFAVVARQLAEFEGRSSLSTWIFAIGQRIAANYRRTQRRKVAPLRPLDGPFACKQPAPDVAAEAAQAADAIHRFAANLDDARRGLFILALLEAVPVPEIAAAEGVSVNTVYSRVRALRIELKALLERYEGEL